MSRLDDELKMAFRREPAPNGFTERVMERVLQQQVEMESRRQKSWFRLLIGWLGGGNRRMLELAALALLLIAIGLIAYGVFHVPQPEQIAKAEPGQGPAKLPDSVPTQPPGPVEKMAQQGPAVTTVRTGRSFSPRPRHQTHVKAAPSVEAEAAKEQVMLALHIASSTLGDAQRSVQEDEDYRKSR
jgi:hypothetical protein